MNFRETLDCAKNNKIDMVMLEVAYELNCQLRDKISNNDFESLCSKIQQVYLKSETLSVYHITTAVVDLMTENSIDDIIKMDKWTIMDKATDYF